MSPKDDRPLIESFQKDLYDKQFAAFNPDPPKRFKLVSASTKSGKSTGALAWLLDQSMIKGGENRNFMWVSPVYSQAKDMYKRAIAAVRDAHGFMHSTNQTELSITNRFGSVITWASGENFDGLYGRDNFAAVIDESSRCRVETWHAIRSTLTATQGEAVLISNVSGRNWFSELCDRADLGAPDLFHTKLTAYDAIPHVLTLEEVESAERLLPPDIFAELYLAEPRSSSSNPFDTQKIQAAIRESLSPKEPVAIGIDLARSADFSAIVFLDQDWNMCEPGLMRFQRNWKDTEQIISYDVCERFPDAQVYIDATGVGAPVTESIASKYSNVTPFIFTSQSKQDLMELLMMRLHREEIGIVEGDLVKELYTFTYVMGRNHVKYQAITGAYDDCVIALSLALKAAGDSPSYGLW
jgi:hypothetical protein